MAKYNYLIGCFILFIIILSGSCHTILILHPVFAGSHIFALRRIIEELLKEGHQIKVVRWEESVECSKMNSPNISETVLAVNNSDGTIPFLSKEERARFEFPASYLWEKGLMATSLLGGGVLPVAAACDTMLTDIDLLQELRNGHFHMAIVDLMYNECGLALAHHLNLPVVGYWPMSFVSGEVQYTTAFNPPSSIPHLYIHSTDKMNFFQRCINVFYGIGSHLVMQIQFYFTNYYIKKYLPNVPHSSVLLSNISGLLINSHAMFDYPKQLPPSFFQVGGFHIKEPKALPKHLLDFIEDSEEGVILFSLGKNFDSHSLPQSVFEAYFNALGRLKQKVILRSNILAKNLPRNIKVMPNLPQVDILAHPKTVLFITHCGMHGVMEAIHFGVKMVAVPIFFDQGNVAVRLVDQGIALAISKTATESDVYETITTVISDNKFEANIKRISHMYHTSLEKPLNRALWLINHVINTNGADHLKLTTKDLNFIQYFCLDILFMMFILVASLLYLIMKGLLYGRKNFGAKNITQKDKCE